MTLIASYITNFGIIQASDSNLTNDDGNVGFGQKIFPIPHLNSSLAYSGSYTINGKKLDSWINEFIAGSFFTVNSIIEFVSQLSKRITGEMREEELKTVTIIHIVGFQKSNGKSYLEHWHISNTSLDSNTGEYSQARNSFNYSNDLNSRDDVGKKLLHLMEQNSLIYQLYINGFPPGRMTTQILREAIDNALLHVWGMSSWKFRKPSNLFEFSHIVKLNFNFTSALFSMSEYNAMYIGGEIQTHLIPVPMDLDRN